MTNICKTCGQEFAFPNPRQYCSHHCQVLSLKESNHNNKKEIICTICNKVFSVPKARNTKRFICNNCKEKQKEEKRVLPERKCKVCGKLFSYDWRKDPSIRKNRPLEFCSRSCANKRERNESVKEKIKKSNKEFYIKNPEARERSRQTAILANEKKYEKYFKLHPINYCKICGKEISWRSKTGFCKNCLNHSVEGKLILSNTSKRLMNEGKIKPWMSQADVSYPENFWMTVLNNNSILYQFQVKEYPYRLDFLIEKSNKRLDLEIDGGQHQNPENREHDIERDQLLSERGFIVYRVPWNEINSKKGSLLMKEKIDKFLSMYNNL